MFLARGFPMFGFFKPCLLLGFLMFTLLKLCSLSSRLFVNFCHLSSCSRYGSFCYRILLYGLLWCIIRVLSKMMYIVYISYVVRSCHCRSMSEGISCFNYCFVNKSNPGLYMKPTVYCFCKVQNVSCDIRVTNCKTTTMKETMGLSNT